MDTISLASPTLTHRSTLLVGGLCERYTMGNTGAIPSQWERFNRYAGCIPGVVDGPAYGVCFNFNNNQLDYLSGIEVGALEGLPREFSHVQIPAQRYAIFAVEDNISTIQRVIHTIWNQWLPASGYKATNAPVVECYREAFDPLTGDGGFEIWVGIEG